MLLEKSFKMVISVNNVSGFIFIFQVFCGNAMFLALLWFVCFWLFVFYYYFFLLLELRSEILSLKILKLFLSIFLTCFVLYNLMGSSYFSCKGQRVLWHKSSSPVGLKCVAPESPSS